jgi:DNA-binding NtrC family response regulator
VPEQRDEGGEGSDGSQVDTIRDLRPLREPSSDSPPGRTQLHMAPLPLEDAPSVRRFKLSVAEGKHAGSTWESTGDTCAIGSHTLNDLVLEDPTVSRFHCEIRMEPDGALITDLRSRNGTVVDGLRVREAYLRGGSILRLGRAVVRFDFADEDNRLAISQETCFGNLVGASPAMRAVFALLERAAPSNATVLLEGETGTGKGATAESIHKMSPRKDGPFVTIDCSAIPANLLESELFGHEKGAFTGADARRIGAFEEASGGTIFLDEIGELPADLQPKLLRVLESKEIRRVGANTHRSVDVRLIAATNRDLRSEVNAGRFRSDLYFRLAVVKIPLPPLRQRPGDIPVLVEQLLRTLGADEDAARPLSMPEFVAGLQRHPWPGNVRELRNYIERCLVFREPQPFGEGVHDPSPAAAHAGGGGGGTTVDASLPFAEARRRASDEFEKAYLVDLLARHGGKVAAAAQAAQIDRVYLYRLLRKHGLGKK